MRRDATYIYFNYLMYIVSVLFILFGWKKLNSVLSYYAQYDGCHISCLNTKIIN